VFLPFSKKEQLASGFSEYIKLVLKKMCFALTACVPLACAGRTKQKNPKTISNKEGKS
jgi:hypothetical protein